MKLLTQNDPADVNNKDAKRGKSAVPPALYSNVPGVSAAGHFVREDKFQDQPQQQQQAQEQPQQNQPQQQQQTPKQPQQNEPHKQSQQNQPKNQPPKQPQQQQPAKQSAQQPQKQPQGMLSADELKGTWKKQMGAAKITWGKLTSDELLKIEGQQQKLAGLVQERYAITRDEADRQVKNFFANNKH
jgi:uncharacterized protein YjbJ (UPF0337 family)